MQQATKERRAEARNRVHMWAIVRRHGAINREKVITANLSRDGFLMRSAAAFDEGDRFFLELSAGRMSEVRVARCDPQLPEYGCRFLYSLPLEIVQTILDCAEAPREMAA